MRAARSAPPNSIAGCAAPERWQYGVVFAEPAADFILALSPRRRRKARVLAGRLAFDPFVRSDYSLADDGGRMIEHLLIEEFVFAYWVDHAVREVRIVDIEDAL